MYCSTDQYSVATRVLFFFFSSRRRHTRLQGDWSSDVCSSDLPSLVKWLPHPQASSACGWVCDQMYKPVYTICADTDFPDRGLPGGGKKREWGRRRKRRRECCRDRKSTRLNSSHLVISYAVFCL